ncbi:MAG: DUF928 domain-containing protein [Symploca sp. SIO2E6]|nr:DUF928 domain-containing protein [Symploca sp. SIO2E6]
MNWALNYRQSLLIFSLTTVLSVPLLSLYTPQAQAGFLGERVQNLFRRDRTAGRPSGRARGGAIRDESCISPDSKPFMALVPEDNQGTTIAAHPTFWFYLPLGRSEKVTQARFVLFDENQTSVIAQKMVELPDAPGIVSVKLPETEQSLEVDKRYTWHFSVICDELERSRNPWLSGSVERVATHPQLIRQLEALPESDQYLAFAEHGISQEALTLLAQHRSIYSDDWMELLAYFELEEFAEAQITQLNP